MIVGSAYSDQANFENATKILVNEQHGTTSLPPYLQRWTNQSASVVNFDSSQLINNLKKGYVAVVHTDYSDSDWGHWMTVLDYNQDSGEIYISNPWENAYPSGWSSVSVFENEHADKIFYISSDGASVNYNGASVTTLDNFLFIGDSRTDAIESELEELGNGITAIGITSSTQDDWDKVIEKGSGTILGENVNLPSKSEVKGISVSLGANDITDVRKMEDVLEKLLTIYPDTPIFVNSVFYMGSGYSYNGKLLADEMNSNIDKFNEKIKELCNDDSNLIYIDVTKDLHENNYLKSNCKIDEIHLNDKGNEILVENIKNAILGSGLISSSNTSSINMSRNIVKKEKGGYKIDIDLDEEVEIMLEMLEGVDFDIGHYLKGSKQKEILKNMLKAAIVTQYPDLREAKAIANDDDIKDPKEVQGCVRFKRYTDAGTENSFVKASLSKYTDSKDDGRYLEYRPYEEFMELVNNTDASAMNYFSMDSSNNIIVAGWETMEVDFQAPTHEGCGCGYDANPEAFIGNAEPREQEYTKLTTKSVNYLEQVSGYDMPFSLLWTLLVYSNDQDFINDLALLVIDTDIVFGCYDLTKVNRKTQKIKYTGEETEEIYIYVEDNSKKETNRTVETREISVTHKFELTEVDTLTTDNVSLKLNHADTWAAEYNREYKQEQGKTETTTSDPIIDDEDITVSQDWYQKTDEGYSGDRKPENEKLAQDVDETINTESNKALLENLDKGTKEANEYNKKFEYRYKALNKVINEKEFDSDVKEILKNKDIQNLMINIILDKTASVDDIKNIFNKENDLVVKIVEQVTNDERRTKDILEGRKSLLPSAVDQVVNEADMYNKVTKNGKDTERNKTYNASITSVQIAEYKKIINKEETVTEETTETKLNEIPNNNNVRWKNDINKNENSFVKLLYDSKKARSNLKILDSWLFESMEETAAIADLVDLIKFLFQCTYNQDYGIDPEGKELKNLFDPKYFETVSSSESSNGKYSTDLEKFIFGGEGGDQYIKGDIYIVYDIGDGCLNIGHGVVIGYSDGTPWYPDVIPNPHVGQEISKETYDKVYELKMKQFTDALDSSLAKYGVTLKQHQYDAMVSFLYNTGYGNSDVIVRAYKNGGEQGLWAEMKQYINPPPYTFGLMRRRAEEYELFTTGDYNYDPIYDGGRVKYY